MTCNDVVFQLEENRDVPPSSIFHVDFAPISGFTYSSDFYDPGTGELTISGVNVTSYKGYGTFTVTVHHAQGECVLTGHIVKCCEGINPDYIFVDENLSDPGGTTTFNGNTFLMMGDVSFTPGDYTFTNCEFYMGPDAQMLPQTDATLEFTDCAIDAFCDCRWDRILLADESNELDMNGVTVKDALRAIHATGDVPISLTGNQMIDNYLSIFLQNFTGTGPYNSSYLKTDGCTFDVTADPDEVYCYEAQASQVNMAAIWALVCGGTSHKVVDILTYQSDNIHVGHENYTANEFKNTAPIDRTAIAINNAQTFVRNNDFFPVITNVCSSNDSRVFIGGTAAQGNYFDQGSVYLDQSSAIINNNTFNAGFFDFINPYHTVVTTGYTAGSEMVENDFIECDWLVDANNIPTYFRIFDNSFFDTQAFMRDLQASASGKLIFHSNYCESSTTGSPVSVQNCDGITFARNHLENLSYYTPSGASSYTGVIWENTTGNGTSDAIASNNYPYFRRSCG